VSGVGDRVRERRDSIIATADTVVAHIVRTAARAYEDSMQPRFDTTLAHVGRSVRKVVSENAASVGESLAPSVDTLLRTARVRLEPLVGSLADTATRHAVLALNSGLKNVLQPTIHDAVRDARAQAESTVRAIRAQAESTAQTAARVANKPLSRLGKILWIVLGVAGTLVVGYAIFVWWSYRRSQQALTLVATEINALGHAGSDLKHAIKETARAHKIEPWLHGFLAKRGLA